jgi:hypothetical protein
VAQILPVNDIPVVLGDLFYLVPDRVATEDGDPYDPLMRFCDNILMLRLTELAYLPDHHIVTSIIM